MKRLLIDSHGSAVRTAYMLDGQLAEIFIDNKDGGSLVGHIINGIVKTILPSQFAFIDIGEDKNAFMNLPEDGKLKVGQLIPVQVRKDATAEKGANLSPILQFKGRYAIIHPGFGEIGVSKKIADKEERKRLTKLATAILPSGYSCILRTPSKGISQENLQLELAQLIKICEDTIKSAEHAPAFKILHRNNIFDDLPDVDEIITNDPQLGYKLWEGETKLFEAFDVERQITKALHRNVWLPCGGFVTFDPVEACVVVDVNTGKFGGKKNYNETIMKTNLEAAKVIARQISLRNLSGMIIIDFIDMQKDEDRNKLLDELSKELKTSRIPSDIVGMTPLGLVQLTRRKQREPLHRLLEEDCPHCNATGSIKKQRGN